MAYDEDLAERVRDALAAVPDVTEKRMFGGLAFMVGGAMALSAASGGGLLVRRAADGTEAPPGARPAVMGSREMHGWLAVDAGAATPDEELDRWVRYAVSTAHHATGSSATP